MSFLTKILGDPSDKTIKKKFRPLVQKVNELEKSFQKKSDLEIRACTQDFKDRIKNGESFEDILPEAFAVAREAAKRTIGQRHYDVQLIGGMVLHYGNIAEMRTGEGKTLVATLAVYLNAISGKGVHVVTVNDYLARRDAVWMGKIYNFLGLSVGVIQHEKSYLYDEGAKVATEEELEQEKQKEQDSVKIESQTSPLVQIDYDHLRPIERKEAYLADITYGTNNEFGFDYLRDNMSASVEQMVQREPNFAIVDEVDSILIDEARTPLIISAPDDRPTDMYVKYSQYVSRLEENKDYNVDEKMRSATLTDLGIKKMEEWLGIENIYTEGGLSAVHHIEQALKARTLFQLDRDYVVREGEVVIVDEFTGRMMQGRRYSEGLHQAIEAKEGVEIKRESRTLATITFQNYFRLYPKLSGMTGTAKTEEEEFRKIYGLDVYVVPTNKLIARIDSSDRVYKSKQGKYKALIKEIRERNRRGQPILIGTISIEQNEEFGEFLNKSGIKHEILNAKNHEREAEIVAQAGKRGAVTLATNMAGRGVDIVLGGTPFSKELAEEVKKAGGLHVIGTERHESRRIDNQLRGRSGRQGDPGSSQFFVSVEDDLMRIFGSGRIQGMMNRLGVPEDMPIENKMVSKAIESAQKRVEGHNFDIRKHVVEYDDVTNRHREAIYRKRKEILFAPLDLSENKIEDELSGLEKKETPRQIIFEMLDREVAQVVNFHTGGSSRKDWNLKEIEETMASILPSDSKLDFSGINEKGDFRDKGEDAEARTVLIEKINQEIINKYNSIAGEFEDQENLARFEKAILLNAIDTLWMDHLESLDNLRTAVGLRGYGQRDPLVEYKRDAYKLFQELLSSIQNKISYSIFKILQAKRQSVSGALEQALRRSMASMGGLRFSAPAKTMSEKTESPAAQSSSSSSGLVDVMRTGTSSISSELSNRFEGKKVGRNDPCPCGSGKKYKKCHGK